MARGLRPHEGGDAAVPFLRAVTPDSGPSRYSLFSQRMDRITAVAYFLGAIVPLVALGAVVQYYRLLDQGDRYGALQILFLVTFIALLSLSCFLVLKRMTTKTLDLIEGDQRRLMSLVAASGSLVHAEDVAEVAGIGARTGLTLTRGRASFVLLRRPSGSLGRVAQAGPDAGEIYTWLEEPLAELGNVATSRQSPAVYGGREAAARGERSVAAAVVVPIAGEADPIGVIAAIQTEAGKGFDANAVDALVTLAGLCSVALRTSDLRDAQRNFFSHVTDILLRALDRHLTYHEGHGERVAQYANLVAHEIGLPPDRMQQLHCAALLHDIGMLQIERAVPHDSKACRKHPVFGFRMLDPIRLWKPAARIVLHHHEWYDGSGYPSGVAGEDIPLEARIVAICDALDAMTSETSYSIALPLASALKELEEGSGTQFDPALVAVVLALAERGRIHAEAGA